jgi:hypothetical protein
VELDPLDERLLSDRPGVRGAYAQFLAVGLTGSADVVAQLTTELHAADASR